MFIYIEYYDIDYFDYNYDYNYYIWWKWIREIIKIIGWDIKFGNVVEYWWIKNYNVLCWNVLNFEIMIFNNFFWIVCINYECRNYFINFGCYYI